jgi:hypothetical protein
MGIDFAGCPRATPPTKTTPSIPVKCYGLVESVLTLLGKDVQAPSRKTVIIGRMKSTHFPVVA